MTKIAQNRTAETIAFLAGNPESKHRVETYKKVAGWLNEIARKEDRPWTWRYVLSVQTGSVQPSEKFIVAVEQLRKLRKPRAKPKPPAPTSPRWWRELRKNAVRAMAGRTRESVLKK